MTHVCGLRWMPLKILIAETVSTHQGRTFTCTACHLYARSHKEDSRAVTLSSMAEAHVHAAYKRVDNAQRTLQRLWAWTTRTVSNLAQRYYSATWSKKNNFKLEILQALIALVRASNSFGAPSAPVDTKERCTTSLQFPSKRIQNHSA
jgi:hypothetical protein